jgi:SPP1 gp7 family putative phage head morphogenesis protein
MLQLDVAPGSAKAKADFAKAHNAARSYGAALRAYAKQITRIIEHYAENGTIPEHRMFPLMLALNGYAAATKPWAAAVSKRMLMEVNRRNLTEWQRHSAEMSFQLRNEIKNAPVGATLAELGDYNVDLITSLPTDAAKRIQEASMNALIVGGRYPDQHAEIESALEAANPDATDKWLKSRATLIARTETARAASLLTQARSSHIGSTHYTWKTAGDGNVRESHRKLNGTTQEWNDPPLSDPPDHYSHPGQIWNCRCIAIPIISE